MMCLELTQISFEEEDDLLEPSDEDDPQYSALVQSVNHITMKAIYTYDEYYAKSRKICSVPFLSELDLNRALDDHEKVHGLLNRETYGEYLDQTFGEVDWARLEW
jgi:hypothetical protein